MNEDLMDKSQQVLQCYRLLLLFWH